MKTYYPHSTKIFRQYCRNIPWTYTGAPIVGIARWSVPRIGQGHLEVKW